MGKGGVVKFDRGALLREIERVEKELFRRNRAPFRRELARVLNIRPTDTALKVFANKYPDKWAQAVTMLANLSGYQPGVNITLGEAVDPTLMTDAALIEEVKKLSVEIVARAQGAAGPVVDVIPLPAPALPAEPGERGVAQPPRASAESESPSEPEGQA